MKRISEFFSKRTMQIIPLLISAVCVLFITTGLSKYGFWDEVKGPTAAFVPTIVCVMLLALCVMDFLKSFKDTKVVKYYKDEFLMIATGFIILLAIHFIGMLPALALFVVVWLKLVEKAPWKHILLILAIVMAIVVGVFVMWLKVRFPEGVLFEMLL